MAGPTLTFFCELDSETLDVLISNQMLANLKLLNARVSLGIIDLNSQQADVVRRFNQSETPVTAWLLLPRESGYWLNLRNAPQTFQRYFEFLDWTKANDLKWESIGLGIEPDFREISALFQRDWRDLTRYIGRLFARLELKRGLSAYQRLIAQIHHDGYQVETYQLPLIQDERKASSTIIQRVLGLVDLIGDKEVWMLYSSFIRPNGPGVIANYGSEARAIGVGCTGSGIDQEFAPFPPLSWDEFARDLRLAWYWTSDIYISNLEGCAQQGFIEKLISFKWDSPIILPEAGMMRVEGWRKSLQSALWLLSHWFVLAMSALGGLMAWKTINRLLRKRERHPA